MVPIAQCEQLVRSRAFRSRTGESALQSAEFSFSRFFLLR